jgi:hypothetical protein
LSGGEHIMRTERKNEETPPLHTPDGIVGGLLCIPAGG